MTAFLAHGHPNQLHQYGLFREKDYIDRHFPML